MFFFSPKHLMDVYFLRRQAHLSMSSSFFPLSLSFTQEKLVTGPSLFLGQKRDNEVSIDLILWKHTDKGPWKPVLVQSPFLPKKVSMKRKAEQHNYSSYWLICFFQRAKELSPLRNKTQTQNWKRERGSTGCTQWTAKIPRESESVEDWGWLKRKKEQKWKWER